MQDTYTVFTPFGGIGGGALGFQQAAEQWLDVDGQFEVLGGIDADPLACADFEMLTGVPEANLDLFDEADYTAWHGCKPPQDWREITLDDIRRAAQFQAPDVLFSSPPCKGFSGLLPEAASASEKYQALNRLVVRGIVLSLEAWRDDPPAIIMLENVPRITTRGTALLRQVRAVLESYGYAVHEGYHDCGELGGLGQHRRRYLLIARHLKKVPALIYRPPIQRVKSIGEILGPMWLPDDPVGGPMHRLPRLQWKTWVRLALIPAGGDWRDLQRIAPGEYRIVPEQADRYRVLRAERAGGALAVEDYRLRHTPMGHGRGGSAYHVQRWDEPSATITADPDHRKSGGAGVVADPRLGYGARDAAMRVGAWDRPSGPVVGSAAVSSSNGCAAVADPRFGREPRADWNEPSKTVTGGQGPNGNMLSAAAPRLTCAPRSGAYRVTAWGEPAGAVTGAGDVHAQGASAVADPRIPGDAERGVWLIVAEDGTWHRPLTTLELAALQGFPVLVGGRPLMLAGNSDRHWREAIGNAVPPPTATAIGRAILRTLIPATRGYWVMGSTGAWVRERVATSRGVPSCLNPPTPAWPSQA